MTTGFANRSRALVKQEKGSVRQSAGLGFCSVSAALVLRPMFISPRPEVVLRER